MLGIPFSGWALSSQTLRMWEMEDERNCISSLSGYNALTRKRMKKGGRGGFAEGECHREKKRG